MKKPTTTLMHDRLRSIAELAGNARRPDFRRREADDFEYIEVVRDTRDGGPWRDGPEFCHEEIPVEVEIIDYELRSETDEDPSEATVGRAMVTEDCPLGHGRFLFRQGDIIDLTEREREQVEAQFLLGKREKFSD